MAEIIQSLKNVGHGFEYLVLGVSIITTIVIAVILYSKWESHNATNAYQKKKK